MTAHAAIRPREADSSPRETAAFDTVSLRALDGYADLVQKLGGDADVLLQRARIAWIDDKPGQLIEYQRYVDLLSLTADKLGVPDFAMRLALTQAGGKVIGPIGVVMRNSRTVGEALGYCAKHIHAYSLATRVRFRPDRIRQILDLVLEFQLDRAVDTRQAVEHALLLANLNIQEISGGNARARLIRFRHKPQAPASSYRKLFGCEVVFGAEQDSLTLNEDDLLVKVAEPDPELHDMATTYIDLHFPYATPPVHSRVRSLIVRHLGTDGCTSERIADELCMHPRTLQRRLRAEGTTFEEIKDNVRREVALRCLSQSDMPLMLVAEKLGYSEASVLSRSCYRWFEASPIQLRRAANAQTGATA